MPVVRFKSISITLYLLQAGQSVLMSSLLLADPTKTYFKLSLWRDAAAWAERIAIGDLVYLRRKQEMVRGKYWLTFFY